MVKLLEIKKNYVESEKRMCDIYADSKNDLVPGTTVEGFGDIELLATGSMCITADFEVGVLKSNGTWAW